MNRLRRSESRLSLACLALCLATLGCAGEAPKHWAELEQCLIGEPLAKEENVFARLRGVQLAETLEASGGRDAWPGRCAGHASELEKSLPDDGKGGMIKRALREALGCDGACAFPEGGHPLPAADKLWEAVARAELGSVTGLSAPKPKVPLKSLTQADWPLLASATLLDEKWSEGSQLNLLLKGAKGYSRCRIDDVKASCSVLEGLPEFHDSTPLSFTRDDRELVVTGAVSDAGAGLTPSGYALVKKQPVGVFGDVGDAVFDGVSFSEKVAASQEPASSETQAPEFEVRRLGQGKVQAKATLKLTARVRGPLVVDDFFVYVERDERQATVFKAKPLASGAQLFGAGDIEYVAEFPGPFQLCESKPGAALGSYVAPIRLLGKPVTGKAKLSVTLLEGKAWHAPVTAEIPTQVGQYSRWRCGPGWGGLSWLSQVGHELRVSELVCKKAGCKTAEVNWSQPDLKRALLLGYVHDKLVLVYESVAGDVRTRVARLSELATAKSTLAFETPDFGGVEWANARLIEGDRAYLVVGEPELRALQIDGNGAVKPVTP